MGLFDVFNRPITNCPMVKFNIPIYYKSPSNCLKLITAKRYDWVRKRAKEPCDMRLIFDRPGEGWYSTNNRIKNLIKYAYKGEVMTQDRKNLVIGLKSYALGLTPKIIMRDLFLVVKA